MIRIITVIVTPQGKQTASTLLSGLIGEWNNHYDRRTEATKKYFLSHSHTGCYSSYYIYILTNIQNAAHYKYTVAQWWKLKRQEFWYDCTEYTWMDLFHWWKLESWFLEQIQIIIYFKFHSISIRRLIIQTKLSLQETPSAMEGTEHKFSFRTEWL